jgi:hypothetical protein
MERLSLQQGSTCLNQLRVIFSVMVDILRLEESHARMYIHWKMPQILYDEVQTRLHISVGAVRESPLG